MRRPVFFLACMVLMGAVAGRISLPPVGFILAVGAILVGLTAFHLAVPGPSVAFLDATTAPLDDSRQNWGVGWGDFDGDGDPDIHLTTEQGTNSLFRNDGSGSFSDVTTHRAKCAECGGAQTKFMIAKSYIYRYFVRVRTSSATPAWSRAK